MGLSQIEGTSSHWEHFWNFNTTLNVNTAINLNVETIASMVLVCCALHKFLRKKSAAYTPFECFDYENIIDGTVQVGAKFNRDLLHNLERRSEGRDLQEAKIIREKFCTYFNGEGSEKSALDVWN